MPESRGICVMNGVAVRGFTKVTDTSDHLPNEEKAVAQSLRENAEIGDTVLIIGGGYGVTTTIASRAVGNEGKVISYEASDEMFQRLRKTLDMNEAEHNVETVHGTVSDLSDHSNSNYGQSSAATISPEDLPNCDILQMDCEGAEIDILEKIKIRPRLLLVETHGFLGSSEENIRELLVSNGYKITNRFVEREDDNVIQLEAKKSVDN